MHDAQIESHVPCTSRLSPIPLVIFMLFSDPFWTLRFTQRTCAKIRNDDVLSGKKHVVAHPDRTLSFPPSNGCHFASQCNQSTVTTNATTKTVKRST